MVPSVLLLLTLLLATGCKPSTEVPAKRHPIIDVHLHPFGTDWVNYFKDTSWFPLLPHPGSNDSLREQTLRLLEQSNVVRAVASGDDPRVVDQWHSVAPERIIPALVLMLGTPIDTIRAPVKGGTSNSPRRWATAHPARMAVQDALQRPAGPVRRSGPPSFIIPYSIEAIDSADFLSPEQKRAILCGNAARFLRLDLKLCEG